MLVAVAWRDNATFISMVHETNNRTGTFTGAVVSMCQETLCRDSESCKVFPCC